MISIGGNWLNKNRTEHKYSVFFENQNKQNVVKEKLKKISERNQK